MKKPVIRAAVQVRGRVFVGLHHYAAAEVASKALRATLSVLIDEGMDEGFTVNGKYLTRYATMTKYGIDDTAQI